MSDDNPFSEAQFKTLKYHPSFPGRFEDQGQAKTLCRSFFRCYNAEHRHGGISMLTPEQVHFGNADQVIAGREAVLREAWAAHPDRFVSGEPKPKTLPEAVLSSGSNQFSGNKSFAKKQLTFADHTGLFLNKWFSNKSVWAEVEIRDRGEYLEDLATGIWPSI